MKRRLANILRIIISLGLLTFLLYSNRGNFADIVEASKNLNIYYLIIAFISYFTAISFIVFRWGMLLKAHDIFISNRFLWQSALIGFFYNNLLPTSAGGDFYRVYDIKQNKGIPVNEGTASVVVERVIGTLSSIILLIIAYFMGLFDYLTRNAALGVVLSGLVIILFFIALFFPRLFKLNLLLNKFRIFSKIRPGLKKFHVILISYRSKVKYLILSFMFTMVMQALFFISYNFISLSLGLELRFYIFIFIIPFVSLVSSVPITIGGIGIRENALVFAVTSFGIVLGQATLFSIILLAIILIIGMIGGIIYLFKNILYKSKSFI